MAVRQSFRFCQGLHLRWVVCEVDWGSFLLFCKKHLTFPFLEGVRLVHKEGP